MYSCRHNMRSCCVLCVALCSIWTLYDSVYACVCVRLFSGLSHRSLRCLAGFYADGLINGRETLVLHYGSLLSILYYMTRHTQTHTRTLTYTHNTDKKKVTENTSNQYATLTTTDEKNNCQQKHYQIAHRHSEHLKRADCACRLITELESEE